MLSDDEFLRFVLPVLRAKRAGQSRASEPSPGSSGDLNSPKNDPNGQVQPTLWFPVVVSQLSKFNDWTNVQVKGHAEALSDDLAKPVDGWIILDQPVMNRDAERVSLLSIENRTITGIQEIRGERVKTEKDVVRLRLNGVETSNRFYVVDFPARSNDHKTQLLIAVWRTRMKAREQYRKSLNLDSMSIEAIEKIQLRNPNLDLKKIREDMEQAINLFGRSRKL